MLNIPQYASSRGAPPPSASIAISSSSNARDRSTDSQAVSELRDIFNLAHRSYHTQGPMMRSACGTWTVDDSDPIHRSERRVAQAAAGLDPAQASPTGRASQLVSRLIEDAYGSGVASIVRRRHPALSSGAPLTPALLARIRRDLVPATLCASGAFAADVGEATRTAIVQDLAANMNIADSCLAVDLNRALYRIDGVEISRPGDDPAQAMTRFIAALPDAETRRVIAQVAHQGTLADADAAASRSDELFPGGFQRIQPHRSWQGSDPLRYDIDRQPDGGYTVKASVRQDAIGVCDPHIGDLDEATRLGLGSHYRVTVEVKLPRSAIANQRYEEISVEANYAVDFHPLSSIAEPLRELISNVRSDRTCMSTYLALTDKLFDAVSHELERRINDGSISAPATAEESTTAWQTLISDAAKELAWQTQREAKPELEKLAFDLNEQVRRFTARLPDAMTLVYHHDHYDIDIAKCDAAALTRATAPFTLMQQAVLPGMAQAAFGAAADVIINEFEITPLRDPDPLDAETSALLRERYRSLDMRVDSPEHHTLRATEPSPSPDLPRLMADGRRAVTVDGEEVVVAYDTFTGTWRVPGVTGFPTGDHLLYNESQGHWVRRAPGLIGGARGDLAVRLCSGELASAVEAMADLVQLASESTDGEATAAAILLQPGVLDALADHIKRALPYTTSQQPHASLPFGVAAQLLHRAAAADPARGAAIVDAVLPADQPQASPIARLLEHHSLHFVQDATRAATGLLRELARNPDNGQAIRERLADRAHGAPVHKYLESDKGLGNTAFREATHAQLAEHALVPPPKRKRKLSPHVVESFKRAGVPSERCIRGAAVEVVAQNAYHLQQRNLRTRVVADVANVMHQRDEAAQRQKAIVHAESRQALQNAVLLERAAFQHSMQDKAAHASYTRAVQATAVDTRTHHRNALRDHADAVTRASLEHTFQMEAIASAQRRSLASAGGPEVNRRAAIAGARSAVAGTAPTAIGHTRNDLVPHASAQSGQHASLAVPIQLPYGSHIDTRTWRATLPVMTQGQSAQLSIPLDEHRPVIVMAAPARPNALSPSTPYSVARRQPPELIGIHNATRGIGVTLAQEGNVSRLAIPHHPQRPVTLELPGVSIAFSAPDRALASSRR